MLATLFTLLTALIESGIHFATMDMQHMIATVLVIVFAPMLFGIITQK